MNKKIFVVLALTVFFIFFKTSRSQAQLDISGFLSGSIGDIRLLIENYAAPFIKGEGHAVANGWYNTGRAHKPFGFDLTFTINSSLLPEDERFFTFLPERYQFIVLAPGSANQVPTAVGPDSPGPVLQSWIGDVSFNTPSGLALPQWQGRTLAFMPIAQVGVGLFARTDLKFRYWPEIKIGKSTNSALGFALMHEIGQWIPLFEKMDLNMSVLAGYTRLKSSYDFTSDNFTMFTPQSTFTIGSYTAQLVLSKDVAAFTFFLGGGYNFIDSNLSYEGIFEFTGPGGEIFEGIVEPISLSLDYGAPQVTVGARLRLAILMFHGAFTFTEYPVGTIGASLGIN
jgi:hypothetical protein